MVGSCDDGCYVWNIDNVDEHQTRSSILLFYNLNYCFYLLLSPIPFAADQNCMCCIFT